MRKKEKEKRPVLSNQGDRVSETYQVWHSSLQHLQVFVAIQRLLLQALLWVGQNENKRKKRKREIKKEIKVRFIMLSKVHHRTKQLKQNRNVTKYHHMPRLNAGPSKLSCAIYRTPLFFLRHVHTETIRRLQKLEPSSVGANATPISFRPTSAPPGCRYKWKQHYANSSFCF